MNDADGYAQHGAADDDTADDGRYATYDEDDIHDIEDSDNDYGAGGELMAILFTMKVKRMSIRTSLLVIKLLAITTRKGMTTPMDGDQQQLHS